MIINFLDRVIYITNLNSYVDNLKFETFTGHKASFSIAELSNTKFMSFSLVPFHQNKLHKRGKYV